MGRHRTPRIAPEDRPYPEGYTKTPVATRYQPGNPGKPKGSKNKDSLADDLAKAFDKPVTVKGASGPEKIAAKKALVRKIAHDSLTGKPKDSRDAFELLARHGVGEPRPEPAPSVEDVDLLMACFADYADKYGKRK